MKTTKGRRDEETEGLRGAELRRDYLLLVRRVNRGINRQNTSSLHPSLEPSPELRH